MKTLLIALFLALSPLSSAFADCHDWCMDECAYQATNVAACQAGCVNKCKGFEDRVIDLLTSARFIPQCACSPVGNSGTVALCVERKIAPRGMDCEAGFFPSEALCEAKLAEASARGLCRANL